MRPCQIFHKKTRIQPFFCKRVKRKKSQNCCSAFFKACTFENRIGMSKEFSKWRSIFWPIHGHEHKRFIPMGIMMFFILFNFSVLRDTKEALVVTAEGSGAQVLPVLKVLGVIPFAFLAFFIYVRLSNIVTRQTLFYLSVLPFVAFFAFFALYLYPNKDTLHLHDLARELEAYLPPDSGLLPVVGFVRNWTYTLFYIMAELWGSIVLSLLFWGFANDVTTVSEAKRFYVLLPLISNFALIFSSSSVIHYANETKVLGEALNPLLALVIGSAIIITLLYAWMNATVFKERLEKSGLDTETQEKGKAPKLKLSLRESIRYIISSKYLVCIAFIVIAYGVCIHTVEVVWKNQLRLMYPVKTEYLRFMGYYTLAIGLVNFPMMLLGTNIVRRRGWKMAAYTTPLILLVTSALFFLFLIFQEQMSPIAAFVGTSPLFITVISGAIQGVLSKSTKYTLFDATKEMAMIPLDREAKVKGKAAIDVVAARFGKFGGASILVVLLWQLSMEAIPPYVCAIVFTFILAWAACLNTIDKRFKKISQDAD